MPNALYNRAAEALQNPNVNRFLDAVIRPGEGTGDSGGYNRIFCGRTFTSYAQHPGIIVRCGGYSSDAAGAFQFLYKVWPYTWRETQNALGLPDFSPNSQRLGAVYLLIQNGALPYIINGDLDNAVIKARGTWPSLPGGKQQTRTWAQVRSQWANSGGSAPAPVPPFVVPPSGSIVDIPTVPPQGGTTNFGLDDTTLTVIIAGALFAGFVLWWNG